MRAQNSHSRSFVEVPFDSPRVTPCELNAAVRKGNAMEILKELDPNCPKLKRKRVLYIRLESILSSSEAEKKALKKAIRNPNCKSRSKSSSLKRKRKQESTESDKECCRCTLF